MAGEAQATAIIAALNMQRHPEGGWYAETFRDDNGEGGRAHSTAIYFLLRAGEVSAWHRVRDAVEVWHFYAGAPLELGMAPPPTGSKLYSVRLYRLGRDVLGGERPQGVVPAGWWQAARSTGAWTLVGCTVAPGFRFANFDLAPPGWTPDGSAFPYASTNREKI